jgi:hypothetical protein
MIIAATAPATSAAIPVRDPHEHVSERAGNSPCVTIDAGATVSIYAVDHQSALIVVHLLSQAHLVERRPP